MDRAHHHAIEMHPDSFSWTHSTHLRITAEQLPTSQRQGHSQRWEQDVNEFNALTLPVWHITGPWME